MTINQASKCATKELHQSNFFDYEPFIVTPCPPCSGYPLFIRFTASGCGPSNHRSRDAYSFIHSFIHTFIHTFIHHDDLFSAHLGCCMPPLLVINVPCFSQWRDNWSVYLPESQPSSEQSVVQSVASDNTHRVFSMRLCTLDMTLSVADNAIRIHH